MSNWKAELTPASAVIPQAIDWLWRDWLARGKLILLAGAGGCGKTTLSLGLAAIVSSGRNWPDDSANGSARNVLIWSAEDDIADTLTPRLIAAGADRSRVFFVSGRRSKQGELQPFNPARDFSLLNERAEQIGGVSLLLVDPIVALVAGDMHRANDVRSALQQLVDFAAYWDCAILGITHLAKGSQQSSPADRLIGSQAFSALARTVLIATQKEGSASRLLVRAKSNIGPDHGGITYTIEEVEVDVGITATRACWGDVISGTARELLAEFEQSEDGQPRSELLSAMEFLQTALANGPMATNHLKDEASAAGIAWGTVRRARGKLGLTVAKNGMEGGWSWELASEGAQS
jgi:putative DNA primase/helicase